MAFYEDLKDYSIMHDSRKEDFTWESTVRLVSREDEMYLEDRGEGRKRKWQEGGKMMREDPEEKVQRKVPPKKTVAALGDMGGSGTSSSSSHMSPGWQVNELDLDLPGELSMNEALLSLPSLAVFKQEAPSPTGAVLSPPRRAWPHRRPDDRQITNMLVDGGRDGMDEGCQVSPTHGGVMMQQHVGNPESMQCQPAMQSAAMMPTNGYNSSPTHENKTGGGGGGGGLLMCSPVSSLDGFLHSPPPTTRTDADNRFQYVLAAATSIATKQNEETLTYLNQGQPYEIKLKKLGDLSHYKGKILKSIIKICFHERRLQYMEREQIAQWHVDRPGERILEVDVPLSYGVIRVEQPTCLNTLHVYWDPTKDVGVYIKVNCISTEFTAKKHGGEKGVPFRIQVETARANDDANRLHAAANRLHAAACQIKVFKLKGADRKHKQDREKVMRRPRADIDKYQPGCEATVLTTLSNDALLPPPSLVTSSPPYSPELCVAPKMVASPNSVTKPVLNQSAILASGNQMKQFYNQDGEMKVNSESCHSPGAILPDLSPPAEDTDKNCGLSASASAAETQSWLTAQRFSHLSNTFNNFAGADLLRLSRDEIIQICGFADGIRLYNALHAKRIEPRVTMYVLCGGAGAVHTAVYLHTAAARELHAKLAALLPRGNKECDTVLVSGPNGSRVRLTDDVVRHLPDHATYTLEVVPDHAAMLLTHTSN